MPCEHGEEGWVLGSRVAMECWTHGRWGQAMVGGAPAERLGLGQGQQTGWT